MRIRTYTTVKKAKFYSAWSKAKTVRTKGKKASNSPDGQDAEIAAAGDEMTLALDEAFDEALLPDEIGVLPEESPQEEIVVSLAE